MNTRLTSQMVERKKHRKEMKKLYKDKIIGAEEYKERFY